MKKTNLDIIVLAKKYGFVLHRQGKHMIFKHPSGPVLVTSKSTDDWRALKNAERDMRRLLKTNHD